MTAGLGQVYLDDLQHIVFTDMVNDQIATYYKREQEMDENPDFVLRDSDEWPNFE